MATSGSVNFNQTRNEIIEDALELLGVYGVGRTVSAEDMAFCSRSLNKMIKGWQTKGIYLWTNEEGVLVPTTSVGQYTLGSGSSDARAANWDDAVFTQLSAAAVISATSLTVDTTSGMAISDIVGIALDDDSIHWTTISAIGSSTTLTITTGLASAAANNNNVYTFTTRINKPLRIQGMRSVVGVESASTTGAATEVAMISLSRQEFMDLSVKGTTGRPTHYYYTPDLTTGTLYLYPRPDTPDTYIRFTYDRMMEDFDSASDNPDFPSEWLEVITFQLALRIAPAFGKEQKASQLILPMAQNMLEELLIGAIDNAGIFIQPDWR